MKKYVGMAGAQIGQVLPMIASKSAMADGVSLYSFVFYSNAIASIILLPLSNSFNLVVFDADHPIVLHLASSSSLDFSLSAFLGDFWVCFLSHGSSMVCTKERPTFCCYVSSRRNCDLNFDRCHLLRRWFLAWKFVWISCYCNWVLHLMWRKAKEENIVAASKLDGEEAPFLQNVITSPSP